MKRASPWSTWTSATEPEAAAVQRLRRRVVGPDVTPLLRALEPIDERAVGRLRARLQARTSRAKRVSPARLGLLAVAVAALCTLRTVPAGQLDEQLTAPQRTERALTPAVALAFRGTGSATGPYSAPRLHWDLGTLDVEVDPTAGIHLVVDTTEASIRVVGTGFGVTRDARGTRVDVAHGIVAVTCEDGWTGELRASETHTCLPVTAAGWLLRVQALQDDGATADVLLDAITRGMALAPAQDPVVAELIELRVEVLLAAGKVAEAREAAKAYPPDGPRAAELARLHARP